MANSSLFRPSIAFFAAAAAATGHLVAAPVPSLGASVAALGVLLLACGASALNQVQERDIDGLMERTQNRPLPAGTLSPLQALIAALVVLVVGTSLLLTQGALAAGVGLAAVAWYNGLYTPLKRRSAFAAVYGAPVGMAAPAVGWAAAGGSLADPRFLIIALLFLLWQVPHFWMLLLANGDDLKRAGLPSPAGVLSRDRLSAVTAMWAASVAAAGLLLPLYGLVRSPLLALLLVASAVLPAGSAIALRRADSASGALPFRMINGFIAAVMVLVAAQAIVSRSSAP